MLLVSLVNEDGEDVEEKLLSTVHDKREEEREEGSVTEGGGGAASADEATMNHTTALPELTTLTVCMTFVSTYGPVYGHDVSPG